MKAESAVVLIRKARMRAFGVQHFECTVDVIFAVARPFVTVHSKEASLSQ